MTDRWQISRSDSDGIEWDVAGSDEARLPHADHIEMTGRNVSVIVRYGMDTNRRLTLTRDIIWPMLRTREGDVRGYLRRKYGDDILPEICVDGTPVVPGPVTFVQYSGVLSFHYAPTRNIEVLRFVFPMTEKRGVAEVWRVLTTGGSASEQSPRVEVTFPRRTETTTGVYGEYLLETALIPLDTQNGYGAADSALLFTARLSEEPELQWTESLVWQEWEAREKRWEELTAQTSGHNTLRLRTPDPILNHAFAFAKFRAAECLFETKMGLVHSPTGGSYYGGIWANDQCEYSGPLFGYLGDADADRAALTAYRIYARAMKPDYTPVPTSFEMEGTIPYHAGGGDRGDAAMIASGLTRYLMFRGDRALAEELWPAVEWCLEYCRRRTNDQGVITSTSDELEGRFPTGDANLSTSSLAYDGLRGAAHLARDLGHDEAAAEYDRRADALTAVIERHFGAIVEGFPTYRYYDGNTVLRSWIALPLTVGLLERAEGTIAALFSPRLWTPDGLATEAGDKVFWDRATLYALRGVFRAGATEEALRYLTAYSRRRLLGDHVPYPVEAYPEGGQAHLSAESALYCRIYVEGLLGLEPTGLRSFRLTPRLPEAWPEYRIDLPAFGKRLSITIRRVGEEIETQVKTGRKIMLQSRSTPGATHTISL